MLPSAAANCRREARNWGMQPATDASAADCKKILRETLEDEDIAATRK
ncbi:MAG TPA: hypothetical protein VGS05_07985 [Candidatus Sulfotelmatobacter sp.]|nr:hypothetical protein [Candidatus Sulfotelmatobacter sp.]